jgi:hypothetical protein
MPPKKLVSLKSRGWQRAEDMGPGWWKDTNNQRYLYKSEDGQEIIFESLEAAKAFNTT